MPGSTTARTKSVPPARAHGARIARRHESDGTTMPFAQWPGMWQPTTRPPAGVADGTVQIMSTRWPDADDDPDPADRRVDADPRRRTRAARSRRRLGGLPRVLGRLVADDRLVDVEPAVDDVEEDSLARRRRRRRSAGTSQSLGDDVDLARRGSRSRARSAASAGGAGVAARQRPAATAASDRGESGGANGAANARRESRANPRTAPRDEPARRLTPARGAPHSARIGRAGTRR